MQLNNHAFKRDSGIVDRRVKQQENLINVEPDTESAFQASLLRGPGGLPGISRAQLLKLPSLIATNIITCVGGKVLKQFQSGSCTKLDTGDGTY